MVDKVSNLEIEVLGEVGLGEVMRFCVDHVAVLVFVDV